MGWLIGLVWAVIIYALIQISKKQKLRPALKLRRHSSPQTLHQSKNDLGEFRINRTKSIAKTAKINNQSLGQWVTPGQHVKIRDYEIKGGFFYCGRHLDSLDGLCTDGCLVNPALPVDCHNPDYRGEAMGYWPNFSDISPQSRAAYLTWLASERDDPTCYIGYVFLYFYGLERRLLVDDEQLSNTERDSLVAELKYLKSVYGTNRSFNGYVTNLLAYVRVLHYPNQPIDDSLLIAKHDFTAVFKLALGQAVAAGEPVSVALALAWVKSHPEHTLRTPARRCETEFDELFKQRYQQKHGAGLMLKPNKTRLRLEYHSASSALFGFQSTEIDLPDVTRLKAPFKKLLSLAEECTDALDAYSRFLGRPGNDRTSLLAIAHLPNDVVGLLQHTQFNQLKQWLITKASQTSVVMPTADLLAQLGSDAPIRINKKEAEMLAKLVEKAGFGLVPDVRFHHIKPAIEGDVGLFIGGHGEDFRPSHAFNQLGTILHLGALVAAIDQHIDPGEVALLENVIDDDTQLSSTERKSLKAYLQWRLHSPASMTGLKTKIAAINPREKAAISHILISVALADGKIDATEIKQLEKLYTSLGLDKSQVNSDVHALAIQAVGTQPTLLAQTSETAQPRFALNRERLKIYQTETQGAQTILEAIFVDNSVEDEAEPQAEIRAKMLPITGLDNKHQSLYTQLVTQAQWALTDVEALCKMLNLMVAGAIEVINDWAFDQVGAPVIDDGSTVYIDLDVAQEINAR